MKQIYKEKQIRMYMMYAVVFGSLFGGYLASMGNNNTHKVVAVPCALAAVAVMLDRDVFLPFLGDAVLPTSVIVEDRLPAGANRMVSVAVPPRTKVMYWASEPGDDVKKSPWEAYKKYRNAGVTTSDENGNATLRIRNPSKYKVPYGNTLNPHVHYRYMRNNGMMSRIFTAPVPTSQAVYGISE
jgi:hypothetical protein